MKKEFVTTNGKVIIENGILQVQTLISHPSATWYWVVFMLMYASTKLTGELKPKPLIIIILIFFGAAFLFFLAEVLFLTTWKRKISLCDIKSYKLLPDNSGLETEVIISLKSGRHKKITFRNLGQQMQLFLEMILQFITQPQTVH